MMEGDKTMMHGEVCKCPHHKVKPLLIFLFGLDFFLGYLGVLTENFVMMTWPILVMAAGVMKMSRCKCC